MHRIIDSSAYFDYLSARNRVCNLAAQHPECDLLVAIEGGVRWDDDAQLECFAWVVIK
jgi:non-canonical (house-cleaning) NTP pyrophosphatase